MYTLIIPVYNGEKFLREAVDSGLAQTLPPHQIILVDDGSTDSSGAVCDRYADRYPDLIKVIHRSNGGLSAARNTGVDAAITEWIMFLDADDVLHPEAARVLTDALGHDTDMASGDFSTKPLPTALPRGTTHTVPARQALKMALYQRGMHHSAWAKMLRRSILLQERFTEGMLYEDIDLFYRYCDIARKVAIVPRPVIYYRQHSGSIIHTWSDRRTDILDITDRIALHYRDDAELYRAACDRRFSAHYNILLLARRHGAPAEVTERCRRVIRQLRSDELRDSHVRLKNRLGALLSWLT